MQTSEQPIKWHALQVKPRSEKKVGLRLSEMGFEVCVPTQKQLRYWSDRKKMIDVVLFNNYVFVATDTKRRNEVFQVGNILKYVQFGGRVAALSEKEVAMIKRLAHVEAPVEITYEGFSVGETVEVLTGPLAGYCGTVMSVSGNTRLQLALPSLHCFANVEIQGLDVRKVINNKVIN
ncbi:MAG: UpxY family transcription antiterminator [Saprospiraceae bacterium]|jgi:transcription antitermination factor NusG|nr:UpxY family transcription antiterminator [Saprospiraceae bacterium]